MQVGQSVFMIYDLCRSPLPSLPLMLGVTNKQYGLVRWSGSQLQFNELQYSGGVLYLLFT